MTRDNNDWPTSDGPASIGIIDDVINDIQWSKADMINAHWLFNITGNDQAEQWLEMTDQWRILLSAEAILSING